MARAKNPAGAIGARREAAPQSDEERSRRAAEKITVVLPTGLVSRMRAAVFYTPGLTVTELVERGASLEIDRLERKRGEPFPVPTGPVRRGRPMRVR